MNRFGLIVLVLLALSFPIRAASNFESGSYTLVATETRRGKIRKQRIAVLVEVKGKSCTMTIDGLRLSGTFQDSELSVRSGKGEKLEVIGKLQNGILEGVIINKRKRASFRMFRTAALGQLPVNLTPDQRIVALVNIIDLGSDNDRKSAMEELLKFPSKCHLAIPVVKREYVHMDRWRKDLALGIVASAGPRAKSMLDLLILELKQEAKAGDDRLADSICLAVGSLGEAALPELKKLIASGDGDYASMAIHAFEAMGDIGLRELLVLSKNPDRRLARQAAYSYVKAEKGPERLARFLVTLLDGDDTGSTAHEKLRRMGPKANVAAGQIAELARKAEGEALAETLATWLAVERESTEARKLVEQVMSGDGRSDMVAELTSSHRLKILPWPGLVRELLNDALNAGKGTASRRIEDIFGPPATVPKHIPFRTSHSKAAELLAELRPFPEAMLAESYKKGSDRDRIILAGIAKHAASGFTASYEPGDVLRDVLLPSLKSVDADVRTAAALVLVHVDTGLAGVADAIKIGIASKHPELCNGAVQSLQHFGKEGALLVPASTKVYGRYEKDAYTRARVLDFWLRVPETAAPHAIPVLLDSMKRNTEDSRVKRATLEVLRKLVPHAPGIEKQLLPLCEQMPSLSELLVLAVPENQEVLKYLAGMLGRKRMPYLVQVHLAKHPDLVAEKAREVFADDRAHPLDQYSAAFILWKSKKHRPDPELLYKRHAASRRMHQKYRQILVTMGQEAAAAAPQIREAIRNAEGGFLRVQRASLLYTVEPGAPDAKKILLDEWRVDPSEACAALGRSKPDDEVKKVLLEISKSPEHQWSAYWALVKHDPETVAKRLVQEMQHRPSVLLESLPGANLPVLAEHLTGQKATLLKACEALIQRPDPVTIHLALSFLSSMDLASAEVMNRIPVLLEKHFTIPNGGRGNRDVQFQLLWYLRKVGPRGKTAAPQLERIALGRSSWRQMAAVAHIRVTGELGACVDVILSDRLPGHHLEALGKEALPLIPRLEAFKKGKPAAQQRSIDNAIKKICERAKQE